MSGTTQSPITVHAPYFPCKVPGCATVFYCRQNLDLHVRLKHRYACQTCCVEYTTRSGLELHRQRLGHDFLTCLACKATLPTPEAMAVHKRAAHQTAATAASNLAERSQWLADRLAERTRRPRKGILRSPTKAVVLKSGRVGKTSLRPSPKRVHFGGTTECPIVSRADMHSLARANACTLSRPPLVADTIEEAIEIRMMTAALFRGPNDVANEAINDMCLDEPRVPLILSPGKAKRQQLARLSANSEAAATSCSVL